MTDTRQAPPTTIVTASPDAADDRRFRPTIAPVPTTTAQPLWSVMIPARDRAGYLRETLASVLAQDPGAATMQIEVVDDHSEREDLAGVVADLGRGRIGYHRQPANVGHVRNFNTCLARARGRLVHLLHGDDVVRPGFYDAMAHAFARAPEAGAVCCRWSVLDEAGRERHVAPLLREGSGWLADWLETLAVGQRLQAPSIVVRRAVYERLGGFDERVRCYGEDWEMWVRIAAHYPVWYDSRVLASYRVHGASLSGAALRTGENIRDLMRVIEINRSVLPADRVDTLTREARRNNALGVLRRLSRAADAGGPAFPLAALRATCALSPTAEVFARAMQFVIRWSLRRAQYAFRVPRNA